LEEQIYDAPQLTNLYHKDYNGEQFCILDENTLFISGGMNPRVQVMNNCYMFNISTNTLVPKENMHEFRHFHGVQKISQRIFAFGGRVGGYPLDSAEVYDIVQNSWKNLPNMPQGGE